MKKKNHSERLLSLIKKFIEKNPPYSPVTKVDAYLENGRIVLSFHLEKQVISFSASTQFNTATAAFRYQEMIDNMFSISSKIEYKF
jgi:hypothetical protein